MPEIPPSASRVAPIPPVTALEVTGTGVASAWLGCPLYHCETNAPVPRTHRAVNLTSYVPGARPVIWYRPAGPVTARPAMPLPVAGVALAYCPDTAFRLLYSAKAAS